MGDAAHAESPDHDVFQKPFKVEPEFEYWNTPENYHSRHIGEDKLPKKMKVWRIQQSDKTFGSVVSRAYNFGYPDDEALVRGYNTGKEYGAVGVGRHGNFLQWGYSAPPSKMTVAGQKFFLNCILYIRKFNGKQPLIRRQSSTRESAVRLAAIINKVVNQDHKNFFMNNFPEELYSEYGNNADGLVQYYEKDTELVYHDNVFFVDHELKKLGIKSNRKISTLKRLIELLDNSEHDEVAKLLLKRYTEQSFSSKREWQNWFTKNRGLIYFSDFGGYKFRVVPQQYLEKTLEAEEKEPSAINVEESSDI